MHYITNKDDHSGEELRDVLRNREIAFDERSSFLQALLSVDGRLMAPDALGVEDDEQPGLFVYRSSEGADWPGGFGIWAAFSYDSNGVLVVLVAKEFSGSDVEHGVLLSAAKRRIEEGARVVGEDVEL